MQQRRIQGFPMTTNPMSRMFLSALLLALIMATNAWGQLVEADRAMLVKRLDARAEHLADVSKKIWEFAEVGYQEAKSAALLKDELRAAGFAITENIANIPTAF